ncbi:MAG: hypothetical protein K5839_03665, partial [Treponemataceae bacterium]|nr:hypothetical protein [Treponemataceae bacterium]
MKKQNFWNLVISIVLIFLLGFWALFIPTGKNIAVTAISILLLLIQILNYFINTGFLVIDNKEINLDDPEEVEKSNKKNANYFLEPVLTKILYPIQMIEAADNALKSPVDQEKQLSLARLIENNVRELKKVIELDFNAADSFINTEEEILPFELQSHNVSQEAIQNVSIGIYNKNREDVLRLNLILQSYGFFTRIFTDSDELMNAIDNKLIQFVIINPYSENDEAFNVCTEIRQKYDILTVPILVIIKKYMTYLIEESIAHQVNTYITEPYDSYELITKIQVLYNGQQLFTENQALLKSEKEKRAFLYFVTHDVNTPLTILLNEIYSLSQIEDFSKIPSNEIQATIENIQHSAEDIDVIIQN